MLIAVQIFALDTESVDVLDAPCKVTSNLKPSVLSAFMSVSSIAPAHFGMLGIRFLIFEIVWSFT